MQAFEFYVGVDNTPQLVAPGLFIGSAYAEANLPALLGYGTTHILTVGLELVPSHASRFTYLHVPVLDAPTEDLRAHFDTMFRFIEEGREAGGVLVHCLAGVSRSASTVIGYLMWKHGMPFHEARRHVSEARPWVNPNRGFVQQLLEFQDLGCRLE